MSIKSLTVGLIVAVFALAIAMFQGCATQDSPIVIDGHVSEIEASMIRLGVGAAMTAYPKAVGPAYKISGAMLEGGLDSIVTLSNLDDRIKDLSALQNIPPEELVIFYELVDLLKADLKRRLGLFTDLQEYNYVTVMHTVIQIVHDAAAARGE